MGNQRKEYIKKCQISVVKTYHLDGYDQKVLFEGEQKNNPIIIWLHGGPGMPIPFCAGSRGLHPKLTKRFIMVYWDQLGCGINDFLIDDTFSVTSYVAMTVDLIQAVHNDFPNNKINLFGVSWGSILAACAVDQVLELINRVLVCGQITKDLFFNQEVFDSLDKANLSKRSRQQVEILKIKEKKDASDVKVAAGLIRRYTEGYQSKNGGKFSAGKLLWGILTSPDYAFRDCKAVMLNGMMKNQSIYNELPSLDISGIIQNTPVPYFIMQGSTDIVTSTKYVKELVQYSENENLHFCIVPNCGHMPNDSGLQLVLDKGLVFLGTHLKQNASVPYMGTD